MTQTSNSSPTTQGKSLKSRRGLRIALVVSLMLNVMLIGILAGGMMRVSRFESTAHVQPDFRSLWRALPAEARADLRAMERARGLPGDHGHRLTHQERRERIAAVNGRIIEMLRAETFDGAAFAALLGAERELLAQRLNAAQIAFSDRVAALTLAQRREMAQTLEESWHHRGPGRFGRGDDD
ncbi:hypothetical protein [Pararhodobacter sp.]|uniref:hypothetical protein n=1 Tax=Pararhodobacter sp. TaxID=2127056 RepID=UPI002AFFAAB0|nr:hypothetical protein [Pararhodobacter sp.]